MDGCKLVDFEMQLNKEHSENSMLKLIDVLVSAVIMINCTWACEENNSNNLLIYRVSEKTAKGIVKCKEDADISEILTDINARMSSILLKHVFHSDDCNNIFKVRNVGKQTKEQMVRSIIKMLSMRDSLCNQIYSTPVLIELGIHG